MGHRMTQPRPPFVAVPSAGPGRIRLVWHRSAARRRSDAGRTATRVGVVVTLPGTTSEGVTKNAPQRARGSTARRFAA